MNAQDRMMLKKWGIFNHYLYGSEKGYTDYRAENKDAILKMAAEWNDMVDSVDTDRLARTLHEMGCGYYFIMVMQGTRFMIAPNDAYSRITGIALRNLCDAQTPYHVVAIKRGDDTIIPSGNDELRNGDIVYFMTKKRHISYIREIVGKEDYADVRNVMIMGGGRTSVHVAEGKPDFYTVKIIERSEERCHRLNELLEDSDIRIIQGDGRNTALLLEEGLSDMQAFCAQWSRTWTTSLWPRSSTSAPSSTRR